MNGDIEAADRWTVEYEAQQHAARGPWILQGDDVPSESLWTSEEFAEMQAATRAERGRLEPSASYQTQPQQLSRA